jgi:hypothetical protein
MQPKEEQRASERRRHRRHSIRAVGTMNYEQMLIPCILINMSRGGAQIRLLDNENALPRYPITLEVRSIGTYPVTVAWQRGGFVGLKFAAEIEVTPPIKAAA